MDNFTTNTGSGGPSFAADDVEGILYPRTKVTFGSDGYSSDVSETNPLPINNDAIVYLLHAIFEKMARVDVNDRLTCNVETGALSSIGTVSNQTNMGGRDASHFAYAMANQGALHIYNNIIVS